MYTCILGGEFKNDSFTAEYATREFVVLSLLFILYVQEYSLYTMTLFDLVKGSRWRSGERFSEASTEEKTRHIDEG
jgi:hypothetical protein